MIAENTESVKRIRELFFRESKSREIRSARGFAEAEVVLPMDGGPHEGEHFTCEYQPVAGLILDELDRRQYAEYYITGPSQSGKTLTAFVIPVLYQVAELRKNLAIAVPDLNMGDDKWRLDIKPVMEESDELAQLLPTSGPGSKGGKVTNTITLTNGAVIKFMSPFGDDANRAGFTAATVCVTEAARFSNPSETSVEADPLRQLKARQRSHSVFTRDGQVNTDRVMIVEGTVTLEHELPWSARSHSTDTRVACQCPHCAAWVTPERENLHGWHDKTTEIEAALAAYFACPACGERLSEDERHEMNLNAILISAGQKADKRGRLRGKPTPTTKFWIRWNAFNNLFTTAADLGREEWTASQIEEDTAERINAEKDLCQSVWCIPYVSENRLDGEPLQRAEITRRRNTLGIGILPEDTQYLTVGVDIGLRTCWFFVIAFRACGRLHCPLYAAHETSIIGKKPTKLENQAIRQALEEIHDRLEGGFPVQNQGELKYPDAVFIDSKYRTDPVFQFCVDRFEAGRMTLGARYWPIQGRGQTQLDRSTYRAVKKGGDVRRVGDGWHLVKDRSRKGYRIELDADRSKLDLQDCLRVDQDAVGALTLYDAPQKEHLRVSRHLASEVLETISDPVKGIQKIWRKTGQNHLLDCAGYALTAGRFVGFKFPKPQDEEAGQDAPSEGQTQKGWFARHVGV